MFLIFSITWGGLEELQNPDAGFLLCISFLLLYHPSVVSKEVSGRKVIGRIASRARARGKKAQKDGKRTALNFVFWCCWGGLLFVRWYVAEERVF